MPSPDRPEKNGLSKPVLLIVEDEAPIRGILSGLAEDLGYETLVAGDGPRALAVAQNLTTPPTIALVDLSLPGMDGVRVLAALLAIFPTMRAVLMSGHGEGIAQQKLSQAGITAEMLPKPFGMKELERLLQH